MIKDEAYVTLATTDNYAIGALTLAQSLKASNTNRALCIMVTKDLSESIRLAISNVFDHVKLIDILDSKDKLNLELLNRPELGVTFTKLHCWKLVQYKKCVFLDADCLVLMNVDDLFDRDEFSAAPDVGWPDCFNSGVFVFRPCEERYASLLKFAIETGSFDGGDQGLLNLYFNYWSLSDSSKRLPFIYNMTTNSSYTYAPAFNRFKNEVKIVHFIGANKPWYHTYNTLTKSVVGNMTQHECRYVNQWWNVFAERVYSLLGKDFQDKLKTQYIKPASHAHRSDEKESYQRSSHELNISQACAAHRSSSEETTIVLGSNQHQHMWEQGQIDYTGRDSFANIQAHLDAQLNRK